MDARLALRTSEERARALHGRADSLLRAAAKEREARARAAERRERLIREGRAAEAVGAAVGYVLSRLEVSVTAAAEARAAVEQSRSGREQELLRRPRRAARARQGARRAGQLRAPRRDGPHPAADAHRAARGAGARGARPRRRRPGRRLRPRPAGPASRGEVAEGEEAPEPGAVRPRGAAKRLRTAERALRELGRVNPLALEEFSAMEERHKFLTEQLEDLQQDPQGPPRHRRARSTPASSRSSPRRTPTSSAAFDATFSRLFPGGEGRLVLTEPDDMLNTGIEVEARPAGKKVKRLSLLSGGERSLVAVCFLVALFKARPVAVLHPRRGRGRARRHQPRPPAGDLRGAARELASCS